MDYIITEDKKKSEHLLLPLIGITATDQSLLVKPDKVFCYWDDICGIDCLELGVFFKENITQYWQNLEKIILDNKYLMSSYYVEGGICYIFTIDTYYKDIDNFIEGKYSKFEQDTKSKIRNYWGNKAFIDSTDIPKGDYYKIVFYPHRYFQKAAEDLGVPVSYLKDNGELMSKPSKEDETVNYKVIKEMQ